MTNEFLFLILCLSSERIKNMKGKKNSNLPVPGNKYGRISVIKNITCKEARKLGVTDTNNGSFSICECECSPGTTYIKRSACIHEGLKGCSKCQPKTRKPYTIGQQFNFVVLEEDAGVDANGSRIYWFRCVRKINNQPCNTRFKTRLTSVLSGESISCGCWALHCLESIPERLLRDTLLSLYTIPRYTTQEKVKTGARTANGGEAEFWYDMYIPDRKLLLESDGPRHTAEGDAERDRVAKENGYAAIIHFDVNTKADVPKVIAHNREFLDRIFGKGEMPENFSTRLSFPEFKKVNLKHKKVDNSLK